MIPAIFITRLSSSDNGNKIWQPPLGRRTIQGLNNLITSFIIIPLFHLTVYILFSQFRSALLARLLRVPASSRASLPDPPAPVRAQLVVQVSSLERRS